MAVGLILMRKRTVVLAVRAFLLGQLVFFMAVRAIMRARSIVMAVGAVLAVRTFVRARSIVVAVRALVALGQLVFFMAVRAIVRVRSIVMAVGAFVMFFRVEVVLIMRVMRWVKRSSGLLGKMRELVEFELDCVHLSCKQGCQYN